MCSSNVSSPRSASSTVTTVSPSFGPSPSSHRQVNTSRLGGSISRYTPVATLILSGIRMVILYRPPTLRSLSAASVPPSGQNHSRRDNSEPDHPAQAGSSIKDGQDTNPIMRSLSGEPPPAVELGAAERRPDAGSGAGMRRGGGPPIFRRPPSPDDLVAQLPADLTGRIR